MSRYEVIQKEIGKTPLQALEAYRAEHNELEGVPMTYAGRLDPMASGKLLLLIGEECKKREKYDGLDKEYEFEILFGFETDTADILGLVQKTSGPVPLDESSIRSAANSHRGVVNRPYPAFSSKTVAGKALHTHALEGTLSEIEVPIKDMRVYNIELLSVRSESSENILGEITGKLDLLQVDEKSSHPHRDFRKSEIENKWRGSLRAKQVYMIAKFRCKVGSGTYIRTLAPSIALRLGTCGLAYSIERTRIGKYWQIGGNFGVWLHQY